MEAHYKKLQDFYAMKPGARIVQKEFGFFSLERWQEEGHITADTDIATLFGFDSQAQVNLWGLGWVEAALKPCFDTVVLEDRGAHELVQDSAGRKVLYFKGRRRGFMPEYVDHPVKDHKTWEELVKWRLDPNTPERYTGLSQSMTDAVEKAVQGSVIYQWVDWLH